MSMRYQAGFLTASYAPLKVPDAPTIGTATQTATGTLSITFTAPSNVGGGAITGYTAVATDSSSGARFIATGSSSPISITGLTTGNTYTVRVSATNAFGAGPLSGASNSVTMVVIVIGQQEYTSPGTYSWVAPASVTSVSVVAVGAGGSGGSGSPPLGGGGGGELRYRNNISVTPGTSYTVVVGDALRNTGSAQNGGASTFNSTTVIANGGRGTNSSNGGAGGSGGTGDGGGNGGGGGNSSGSGFGGGGGAGGYAGAGGNGAGSGSGSAGSGGGAGGGGYSTGGGNAIGGPGGGTYLTGQSTNGAGGLQDEFTNGGSPCGGGGGHGSGSGRAGSPASAANFIGGGGPGYYATSPGSRGAFGGVRIIWPGTTRAFPSTNTGDL